MTHREIAKKYGYNTWILAKTNQNTEYFLYYTKNEFSLGPIKEDLFNEAESRTNGPFENWDEATIWRIIDWSHDDNQNHNSCSCNYYYDLLELKNNNSCGGKK